MKKNKKLKLVKADGDVKKVAGTNQLINDVTEVIRSYGNIESLERNKDLWKTVCKLVHNSESAKLEDAEKDDLVVDLLTKFFPVLNNSVDRQTIRNDSAWMRKEGIVKEVTLFKKISKSAFGWLKKKVL